MFTANKLHQLKCTGLLLRQVSATDNNHPQGLHFTKEAQVLQHSLVVTKFPTYQRRGRVFNTHTPFENVLPEEGYSQ
jgi:hypothetical protein